MCTVSGAAGRFHECSCLWESSITSPQAPQNPPAPQQAHCLWGEARTDSRPKPTALRAAPQPAGRLPLVPAVTPSKSQSLVCSQALSMLWPGTAALPRWVITGTFTFKVSLWYRGSEKGLWQSEDSVHCPFEDLRFPPSPPAAPLKDFMWKERGKNEKRKGRKKKKKKEKI